MHQDNHCCLNSFDSLKTTKKLEDAANLLGVLYIISAALIGHNRVACQNKLLGDIAPCPAEAIVDNAVPTTPMLMQTLEMPDGAKTDKACCTAVSDGAVAIVTVSQLTTRGLQLRQSCLPLVSLYHPQ